MTQKYIQDYLKRCFTRTFVIFTFSLEWNIERVRTDSRPPLEQPTACNSTKQARTVYAVRLKRGNQSALFTKNAKGEERSRAGESDLCCCCYLTWRISLSLSLSLAEWRKRGNFSVVISLFSPKGFCTITFVGRRKGFYSIFNCKLIWGS